VRSTKIVATLGPATSTLEQIRALIDAGMDVARINFSHGDHAEHRARIAAVRKAGEEAGRAVAILQDLQGPKIRTGSLSGGQPVLLSEGAAFSLTTKQVEGNASGVSTGYQALPGDVEAGNRILLSDGAIELRVCSVAGEVVHTEVMTGGLLAERQGIHLPGVTVSAPAVTEKDLRDLEFGLAEGVEFVALSFVRSASDVREVKERIAAAGHRSPVVAKIERLEAIDNLAEILDVADGAMVARGDLGVEMPPERVPLAQKQIIAEANRRSVPVITATQMLESMIEKPQPTRAEASDVANAIIDGTDAVMLSGETAVGQHPVKAVETAGRIAAEMWAERAKIERHLARERPSRRFRTTHESLCAAVEELVHVHEEVSAIWVLTLSGRTARLVSGQRPRVPILGFTPDLSTYRGMSVLWGVTPVYTDAATDFDSLERKVISLALERELARRGDTVVLTGSHPFEPSGATNFLKVVEISS
jgi:pyruvate kinase